MSTENQPQGPLAGVRVLEVASIGPGPYCSMLLSDMGAEILRLDRIEKSGDGPPRWANPMNRGRRSVAIDLKKPGAAALALDLAERADILVEGFRPGVMERLGLGPEAVLARNPRLVYGRMTGWGQDGPRAALPGHDINYIATTGALAGMGPAGAPPLPPLNLVGDFSGALFLAFGLVAALFEAGRSGRGQVVDAAMVDASASMMTMFTGMLKMGLWTERRGTNVLDGGAPFYGCYETADGHYVAVGAIEAKFFAELVRLLGLPDDFVARQHDRASWPAMAAAVAEAIRTRTRDEWADVFAQAETCLTPVLRLSEAPADPHNDVRAVFVERDGTWQPAPAPRLSRTPGAIQGSPRVPGADTLPALADWGCDPTVVRRLLDGGVLYDPAAADCDTTRKMTGGR
ncbi:MAG: CoA transferase [Hyphomicrobiales bacterium]|nr:CoA transferase [Hyphomicrobiales bacterium]MCP5370604.1 CoA transferase [Hyphomicrobiales bacterium]